MFCTLLTRGLRLPCLTILFKSFYQCIELEIRICGLWSFVALRLFILLLCTHLCCFGVIESLTAINDVSQLNCVDISLRLILISHLFSSLMILLGIKLILTVERRQLMRFDQCWMHYILYVWVLQAIVSLEVWMVFCIWCMLLFIFLQSNEGRELKKLFAANVWG
jgi:hypothetical protein